MYILAMYLILEVSDNDAHWRDYLSLSVATTYTPPSWKLLKKLSLSLF